MECMVAYGNRHASPARRDRQLQKTKSRDIYRIYMFNLHVAFPSLKPGGCLNDGLVNTDKSTELVSIEATRVIADAIQTVRNKVAMVFP